MMKTTAAAACFSVILALLLGSTQVFAADTAPRIPVPPPEHPRLYLRTSHVASLPVRLAHPVLAPVAARLERLAAKSPQYNAEWRAPAGARTP